MKKPSFLKSAYLVDPSQNWIRAIFIALFIVILILLVWNGYGIIQKPVPRTIMIYCFSGMEEVMMEGVFPAFREHWMQTQGERVEYITTFAGSGEISTAVLKRFPAEVAVISSKLDAIRLQSLGVTVNRATANMPHGGVIARTPLVIIGDKPKLGNISDFPGLADNSIGLIFPDPETSGAGQLGLLAIYGSALANGLTADESLDLTRSLWENRSSQPSSAREALKMYRKERGSATITYESNLVKTPYRPQIPGKIVYPDKTIICEPVIIELDKNIRPGQKEVVAEFTKFLWSEKCQSILVDFGYKSIDAELNLKRSDIGLIRHPLTLNSLGNYYDMKEILENVLRKNNPIPTIIEGG